MLSLWTSAAGEDAETNGLEDIVSRMKDLATNRGDVNRRSKRDRSFLKTVFRDHYKAVEVVAPLSVVQGAYSQWCTKKT